jgi:prepilin-type processing-associated H-X9-DG protein
MGTGNQISCPHCGQTYDLTPEQAPQYAGQTISCTKCQRSFMVPAGASGRGSVVPPAPLGPPPQPQQPGQAPPPHVPYGTPAAYQQTPYGAGPQQTNGWAITSLVTGCIGLLVPIIPGLIAVITGIIGLKKTKDPRVGGKGLAIAGLSIGAASLVLSTCMVSILLPSLNRAREQANRIKCASNMRQIGQAIMIYANENRGAFPADLDVVLKNGDVTSIVFVCPASSDTAAPAGSTLASGPHSSYVYVGQGLTYTAASNVVVLYEPLTTHRNDGTNVLFADGHVDWIPAAQATKMVAEVQAGQNPPPSGPK